MQLRKKGKMFIHHLRDLLFISVYKINRKPWTFGYNEYRWVYISRILSSHLLDNKFLELPSNYGIGIDERIVEYPWTLSRLDIVGIKILDAGSTFNFNVVTKHPLLRNKELTIYTFNPEINCFYNQRISYIFGDLREIPIKNENFDSIACISTIEHIGMNNSIYGHSINEGNSKNKDFILVIKELLRILKNNGQLLLTFPYGKYENHGFFQQFDSDLLECLKSELSNSGRIIELSFFKYTTHGWSFADQSDVDNSISYNPHTGTGKLNDGAAHCRAICCLSFRKKANDLGRSRSKNP